MYYAYILKHDENVGNGMASLDQLEKVYDKGIPIDQTIEIVNNFNYFFFIII